MLYNFIVCEDNLFYRNKILSVIDKIVFDFDLKCQRFVYDDFNEDFEKIIDQDLTNKIYILDIETNSNTGTNIARKIRKSDMRSVIIFITSYFDKYLVDVTRKCLFLDYINKKDDYEKLLYQTLEDNIKNTNKALCLYINARDTTYTCNLNEIEYIYFDSNKRKTVIYENEHYKIACSKALCEIYELLDHRFAYCSKSVIINLEHIKFIDKINKIIYLKSEIIIDKVSENCLKEIIKKLDELYKS